MGPPPRECNCIFLGFLACDPLACRVDLEGGACPSSGRHRDERSHEADPEGRKTKSLDCFAEPVIGPRVRADPLARNDGYCAGSACARGPPRIRATSSAVGQESAGRPYFTCIALLAVRLCWPRTPSTLPTSKPARTRSCCSSLLSLNGNCATGPVGRRIGGAPAIRLAR